MTFIFRPRMIWLKQGAGKFPAPSESVTALADSLALNGHWDETWLAVLISSIQWQMLSF